MAGSSPGWSQELLGLCWWWWGGQNPSEVFGRIRAGDLRLPTLAATQAAGLLFSLLEFVLVSFVEKGRQPRRV